MNNFFFGPIDLRKYAALRILVGVIVCLAAFKVMPFARQYYSNESWFAPFPWDASAWSLFSFFDSPAATQWLVAMMALSAFCFAAGFFTKSSGVILFIMLISGINRNPFVQAGDQVFRATLMCLLFSPCGQVWSLDAWLRGRSAPEAPAWPLRMLQFQIAFMYFFTGVYKFVAPEWIDGSAIEFVLTNPKTALWPMHFPGFMAPVFRLAAWSVVFFELSFPLFIALRWTRKYIVFAGIVLHAGLAATVRIEYFGIFMVGLYLCYVPDRYFASCGRFLRTLK